MLKILLYAVIMISLWMPSVYARNELLVSSDSHGRPYAWEEENQLVGPIVDLITLIFKDFGIPVKTIIRPWPRVLFEMEHGNLDVIMTIFYTSERTKFMAFTVPYSQVFTSVFVKRGKEFPFNKWEDLIDRNGLKGRGDSFGSEFDRFSKKHLKFQKEVGTPQQIIKMLDHERADYTIQVKIPMQFEIVQMGYQDKIVPLDVPVTKQDVYIAFSKKSPFLKYLPKVNHRIQEMRDNGALEKMIEKVILDYAKQ